MVADDPSGSEQKAHYDVEVHITQYDLNEGEAVCDWCGGDAVVGLEKSKLHRIAFCEHCSNTLQTIIEDDD